MAAAQRHAADPAKPQSLALPLALPITSMVMGIPLSGITLRLSSGDQLIGLAIVWSAIAAINVAYALGSRSRH